MSSTQTHTRKPKYRSPGNHSVAVRNWLKPIMDADTKAAGTDPNPIIYGPNRVTSPWATPIAYSKNGVLDGPARLKRLEEIWTTLDPQTVIDLYHQLYYGYLGGEEHWLGHGLQKCPLDLWVYQEIIYGTRPTLILETGTDVGGSAKFLASICLLLNCGRVITIDIEELPNRPVMPNLKYLTGRSTDPAILKQVQKEAKGERVMVILDSDHSTKNVLAELDAYAPLVSLGCYLICEDTNIDFRPIPPPINCKSGPGVALDKWLPKHPEFTVDKFREKFGMTLNPGGYIRRY